MSSLVIRGLMMDAISISWERMPPYGCIDVLSVIYGIKEDPLFREIAANHRSCKLLSCQFWVISLKNASQSNPTHSYPHLITNAPYFGFLELCNHLYLMLIASWCNICHSSMRAFSLCCLSDASLSWHLLTTRLPDKWVLHCTADYEKW